MASSTFLDAAIRRANNARPSIDSLPKDSIAASLFDGAAGVAFFLHEVARLRDPSAMQRAVQWIDLAEAWAKRATKEQWQPEGAGGAAGFIHGIGGMAYVRILVSSAIGDSKGVARGVDILAKACKDVRSQRNTTSLFEGEAGLLSLAGQVQTIVGKDLERDVADLRRKLSARMEESLSRPIAKRTGLYRAALGMAHGLAGEIWSFVTWGDSAAPFTDFVLARTQELFDLAERDESAIVWPSMVGMDFGYLPHTFCNGMAGHAFFWEAMARRGMPGASKTSKLVAQTMCLLGPATDTPILCCGLAGQSLVHETVAQNAGADTKKAHRDRARARLARASKLSLAQLRKPTGLMLWRGGLGVAMVVLLRHAGERHVPCLESPSHT